MGYMLAYGTCFGCKQLFSCNPHRVPSIRVNSSGQSDQNGNREPVCRGCIEAENELRMKNSVPQIVIATGAYEPVGGV